MYKVIKDKGVASNVFLKNTSTNAEVNLGRISVNITDILEDEGIKFGKDEYSLKDAWDIEIHEEAKEQLEKLAWKVSKPVRNQSKKSSSEQKTKPRSKQPIDVFDLIFGTN